MADTLYTALCDLTDALQRLCPRIEPEASRCEAEVLVQALDALIAQAVARSWVTRGLQPWQSGQTGTVEEDTKRCPKCGAYTPAGKRCTPHCFVATKHED